MVTWSGRQQWRWTQAERFDLWREAKKEKGWFLAEVAWRMGLCSLMRTHGEAHRLGFGHTGLEQLWFQQDVLSLKLGCGKVVVV